MEHFRESAIHSCWKTSKARDKNMSGTATLAERSCTYRTRIIWSSYHEHLNKTCRNCIYASHSSYRYSECYKSLTWSNSYAVQLMGRYLNHTGISTVKKHITSLSIYSCQHADIFADNSWFLCMGNRYCFGLLKVCKIEKPFIWNKQVLWVHSSEFLPLLQILILQYFKHWVFIISKKLLIVSKEENKKKCAYTQIELHSVTMILTQSPK